MQTNVISIFKPWVGEWAARTIIFVILMSCLFSFAFYGSAVATMGYYGVQPTDVQYGMVMIYGSTVAFLALDFRISKYLAPRKYLLIALGINAICSTLCFYIKDWGIFIVCQFVQGVTCALISGVVLQLIFPRLKSTRARVIAFSILYGSIQISVPFYSSIASIVLYYLDFNWLFYFSNIVIVLLVIVVLLTMNSNVRFTKKIPLYQVDWIGYFLYVSFILILGYILVYGRRLGWFDSTTIIKLVLGDLAILVLFVIRELNLKRPLINFYVFKAKNFIPGLLMLFAFYIFKGSIGLSYTYLDAILGEDPLNTIPIWLAVIIGTILSMFVTYRFVLLNYNLLKLIIVGFGVMAIYYVYVLMLVSVQGELIDFLLPMFIYGIATGILFVPIVVFTTSTASPKIALNASYIGIFARFTGFTASMAFSNELQLFAKASVRERTREVLTEINPQLSNTLISFQNKYNSAGSDLYTVKTMTGGDFNQFIGLQILSRATRYYYDWMLVGIIVTILLLMAFFRCNLKAKN